MHLFMGSLPHPCHNQDVGIFANVYLEAGHVLEVLVGVSAAVAGIVVVAKDHTLLSYNAALVSKMFIHHVPQKGAPNVVIMSSSNSSSRQFYSMRLDAPNQNDIRCPLLRVVSVTQ